MSSGARADPLGLLRASVAENAPATLADELLVFRGRGALRFETPTAWRAAAGGECLSVGDLWLFLDCELRGEPAAQYYKRFHELSGQRRVSLVPIEQQAEVRDYFFGRVEHSRFIDNALREVVAVERPEESRRSAALEGLLDAPLEPMVDETDPEDARDLECLRKWERPYDATLTRLRRGTSFAFCIEMMENARSDPAAPAARNAVGNSDNVISHVLGLKPHSLELPRPVIVVPNEQFSGNISLQNAERFLAQGVYVPAPAETGKVFHWELDVLGKRVVFEVWDDLNALKERRKLPQVVALFLTGNPYQFKNIETLWKEPSIARLFNKSCLKSSCLSACVLRCRSASYCQKLQCQDIEIGQSSATQGSDDSSRLPGRFSRVFAQHQMLKSMRA